jgi:hypothetical protein
MPAGALLAHDWRTARLHVVFLHGNVGLARRASELHEAARHTEAELDARGLLVVVVAVSGGLHGRLRALALVPLSLAALAVSGFVDIIVNIRSTTVALVTRTRSEAA